MSRRGNMLEKEKAGEGGIHILLINEGLKAHGSMWKMGTRQSMSGWANEIKAH